MSSGNMFTKYFPYEVLESPQMKNMTEIQINLVHFLMLCLVLFYSVQIIYNV